MRKTSYMKCGGIRNYRVGNFMVCGFDTKWLAVITKVEIDNDNPDEGTIHFTEANFFQKLQSRLKNARLWFEHEFPRDWKDCKYLYRRHIAWRFK